jgi:hypothetical protein
MEKFRKRQIAYTCDIYLVGSVKYLIAGPKLVELCEVFITATCDLYIMQNSVQFIRCGS